MKCAATANPQDEDVAYERARQRDVDEVGIHRAVPMQDYLSDQFCSRPSLSAHIAQLLLTRSPLHAWTAHPRLNPHYRSKGVDVFDYGTAAHAIFLEGDESRFVVVEANDWRTKEAKELRTQARAAGKIPLLARQHAQVRTMAEVARTALQSSELAGIEWDNEVVMLWEEDGYPCRGRIDSLSADRRIILDYKTTENAHPDAFARSAFGYGYDTQQAFYVRGLSTLGHPDARFVFLAQETESPFACSLIGLDPAATAIAAERVQYAIKLWQECVKSGDWPGYPNSIAWLEPPGWRARSWEEMMELGGQA